MDQQNIIIPNGSLMIVDRGWLRPKGNGAAAIAPENGQNRSRFTGEKSLFDDVAITILKKPLSEGALPRIHIERSRPGYKHYAMSTSARKFAFVNSTGLSRNRDPYVQKLVRSYVMKGLSRDQTGVRISGKATNASRSGADSSTDIQNEMSKYRTFTSPKLSPVLSGYCILLRCHTFCNETSLF